MKSGFNLEITHCEFFAFDKGNIIILANGFHKKTNKTPVGTIKKAIKIQKEYEAAKDT